MRFAVSTGERPAGTSSVRNSPVISPAVLLTSSPKMTVKPATALTAWAPARLLWSVTAMQSRPTSLQRRASASGDVMQSKE